MILLLRSVTDFTSSLLGMIFFYLDSDDWIDHVVDSQIKVDEKTLVKASYIVSTYPSPKDYLIVGFKFYSF